MKRYKRREVYISDIISYFFISLFIFISSIIFLYFMREEGYFYYLLAPIIILDYFMLRRFLIGMVLVYKVLAPESIRAKCRFTPTCSTYMIMSIQKYGIICGVYKGIRRLRRCKPPYGGIDYP